MCKKSKCKLCGNDLDWGKYATEKEKESGICSICWNKPFEVKTVCRGDLADKYSAKEIGSLNDDDMNSIASGMGDAIQSEFWVDLEICVDKALAEKPGSFDD